MVLATDLLFIVSMSRFLLMGNIRSGSFFSSVRFMFSSIFSKSSMMSWSLIWLM